MSDFNDVVPPSSSRKARQKRDELPLDDGLSGVIDPDALPGPESVERTPASRKLTSVRGTEIDLNVDDILRWEIDGLAPDAPATRKANREASTEGDTLAPDVLRKTLPDAELVVLVSSARAPRPATFGELLDIALELGE